MKTILESIPILINQKTQIKDPKSFHSLTRKFGEFIKIQVQESLMMRLGVKYQNDQTDKPSSNQKTISPTWKTTICECGIKWVGRWYSLYNKHFYHCLNNERKYFKNAPNRKHLHSDTCSKPKRIGGEILDRYVWKNLLSNLGKIILDKRTRKKEILGERYGISSMRKNLNKDKKRLEKEIKTFERNKVDFIKDKYTTSLNEFDYDEIISSIDEKIYELQSDYKKLQDKEMIMDKEVNGLIG